MQLRKSRNYNGWCHHNVGDTIMVGAATDTQKGLALPGGSPRAGFPVEAITGCVVALP